MPPLCIFLWIAILECLWGRTEPFSPQQAGTLLKGDRPDSEEARPGWHELSRTRLSDDCPKPAPAGNTGCAAIISAWGGAIADTKENRMILWGGGHQDYYGNELYALNLARDPVTMTRLTEPSSSINRVPMPKPTEIRLRDTRIMDWRT